MAASGGVGGFFRFIPFPPLLPLPFLLLENLSRAHSKETRLKV